MSPQDFIEPSLADAPALRLDVDQNGRVSFLVHGIARVYSLEAARSLLTDRRIAPRTPELTPEYLIQYGEPANLGAGPSIYGFRPIT